MPRTEDVEQGKIERQQLLDEQDSTDVTENNNETRIEQWKNIFR